ncbi:MAG: type II toxin-antitoxin system VapC family toxin [Chloroflexota bacterium]
MLLLDSHILLWWLDDDPRLPGLVREAILDEDAVVYVSAATVWEIEIKVAAGRLEIGQGDILHEIVSGNFAPLAVTVEHAAHAARLPHIHSDPFDRMLVAQAQLEHLTLATVDADARRYDVSVIPPTRA